MATDTTTAELVRLQFGQPEDWDAPEIQAAGGSRKHGPTVDESTGDVVGWAMGVDAKKTPNRRGFVFKWEAAADIDASGIVGQPMLFWMHDHEQLPIGQIDEVQVTQSQVWIKFRIWGDEEALAIFRDRVLKGRLNKVSIGFYIRKASEVDDPKRGAYLLVQGIELVELSLVTIGAHETAEIKQAMGGDGASMPTVQERTHETIRTVECVPMAGDGVLYRLSAQTESVEAEDSEEQLAAEPTAAPERRPWADVARDMAKLLGARGGLKGLSDEERQARYDALFLAYADYDREPPELCEYTTDELKQMHADGAIVIPGAPAPATQAEAAGGSGATGASEVDLAAEIAALKADIEALKQRVTADDASECTDPPAVEPEPAETQTATPPATADPVDVEALRPAIRAMLESDPEVTRLRDARTAIELARLRQAHRPRMQ